MFEQLTQADIGTFAAYAAGTALLVVAGLVGWNRTLRKKITHHTTALQESEQRFRQLAENIREVFWLTDPGRQTVLYVSPAFEEIWGRTCASLYAAPRRWLEAIHVEDRDRVEAAATKQASGRYDELYRIIQPDGSIRWIHDRAFPVRDASGKVYRVAGVAADVTERKRTEDERRESERRFREMLENVDLIAVTLDRQARVTFCNDYLLKLTGWRRKEVIGCDWFVKFIPDTSAEMQALYLDKIDAGQIPQHHENPIKTRFGQLREVRWNTTILRDAAGKISGTATIGEDITDRTRAEMASIQLAAIVESSDDAIIGKDLQGIVTSWNHGAENIFGYSAREIIGTSIVRLNPTDRPAERKQLIEKIRAGERVEHFETVRQTKDGRRIDISAAPSAIKDAAGEVIGVSIVARDISAQKRAEVELRTARKQLRALVGRLHTVREEEAKRIARELHDDLGQQLTALNLKLAHLLLTLPDATPQQRDQFGRMQTIVDHTIEVVQKIAGELRLGQLDVFGLTAAIEWHLQEFSRLAGISCRIMRLDEVAHLTDAQNTAVFRILQEALTNVARHAHATEVEISLRAVEEQLMLTVRDNGRGITPAELKDHKAIGLLGMAERAALVGGGVTITGGAEGGTTVLVRIPLNRPEVVAA